jgi:teichuronic acid biosynthesis glycosyltransferase TuaC
MPIQEKSYKCPVLLYLTNSYTHPVVESQTASPRYILAKKLAERRRVLMSSPIGRHVGSPLDDFIANLRPAFRIEGNLEILFPPVLKAPGAIGTLISLFTSAFFLLFFVKLKRLRISGIYATTVMIGLTAVILNRWVRAPFVTNYGDPDFAREKGIASLGMRLFEEAVIGKKAANAIIYIDPVIRKHVQSRFPNNKFVFLPPGAFDVKMTDYSKKSPEVDWVRSRYGITGSPVIIYAGHIAPPPYRVDLLVKAAPEILKEFPNAMFILIGEGSALPAIITMVRERHLESHFLLLGAIPYNELGKFLASADVAVQLLDDMCQGAKILTYMARGKPIVSAGGWYDRYTEFLLNGTNCLLVPPSTEELARSILMILSDKQLAEKLGYNAYETVKQFTWEKHVELTLEYMK